MLRADGRLFVGDLKVTGMEDGGWYWIDGPSGVPPPTGKPGLGYTGPRTLDGPLTMTDDELREHFARIAVAQDRTDAQLKALAASQDRTDAQLAKTDAKLDRLAEMYGGLGNSVGDVAEEFFFNSLAADPVLGGVRFDVVLKNIGDSRAGLVDEFDLVLVNGREVLLVEVKYKAHRNDLRRLVDKKAANFRRLFPGYADREQRLALASFRVHDELKREALRQGVTVLQRKGDVIETAAA